MKLLTIFTLVAGAQMAASKAVGSWHPPEETGVVVAIGQAPELAPKPTALAALGLPELFRRDGGDQRTCAYLNGSSGKMSSA